MKLLHHNLCGYLFTRSTLYTVHIYNTAWFFSSACEEFTYGYNCNGTCGQCADDAPCDVMDGACLNGCVLGLQPPLCQAST